MEPEKEVNFIDLLRELNRYQIRYLIMGRRAVILYGGPVLTADRMPPSYLSLAQI